MPVILFDVYGTLLDVHGVALLADSFFPGHGAELSRLWRDRQLQYTWLRSLGDHYADFEAVTADALDQAAAQLALPLTPDRRVALLDAYLSLPAFADAEAALAALRARGITLAVLSNGTPGMLEPALQAAGLRSFLDRVISVDAVRRYKPAREAYALGLQAFGGLPADILFVSSNGWDVAGAAWFGYGTFWINRAGAAVERLGVAPGEQGRSLADLVAALKRPGSGSGPPATP